MDEADVAHIRIEMDRGNGWELRSEGDAEATVEQVIAQLPGYASSYPHRAIVDGAVVAEAQRPHGLRGKVKLVRATPSGTSARRTVSAAPDSGFRRGHRPYRCSFRANPWAKAANKVLL